MVEVLPFWDEVPKSRDELQICDVVRGVGESLACSSWLFKGLFMHSIVILLERSDEESGEAKFKRVQPTLN